MYIHIDGSLRLRRDGHIVARRSTRISEHSHVRSESCPHHWCIQRNRFRNGRASCQPRVPGVRHGAVAATRLDAYEKERSRVAAAVAANFEAAPEARSVAEEIARAIESPYRLRRPVGSQAKRVGRLRRFMPAGAVDRQLRKVFALE